MRTKLFTFVSILAVIAVLTSNSFAITWFPQEFSCPIDKTKNTFQVVGSYGSYVYSYPSKYQWLFFPMTDSPTFYLCKKCHLATYMWDFDKLPKDKLPEIQKALLDVKFARAFKEYTEVPVTERLEVMEKVYGVLNKDEEWWEQFYRVKGYHYDMEGKSEKAAEARRKSLEIVARQLKDEKNSSSKKLLYYISGAMKHFLNDDKSALVDLQKGLETKYQEKDAKPEDLQNAENGMNERIKDYIERINSDKKPRLTSTIHNDH